MLRRHARLVGDACDKLVERAEVLNLTVALGECAGPGSRLAKRCLGLGQYGLKPGRRLGKVEGVPDELVAELGRVLVAAAADCRAERQHSGAERLEHRDGQPLVVADVCDEVPPAQHRPVLVARLAAVKHRAAARQLLLEPGLPWAVAEQLETKVDAGRLERPGQAGQTVDPFLLRLHSADPADDHRALGQGRPLRHRRQAVDRVGDQRNAVRLGQVRQAVGHEFDERVAHAQHAVEQAALCFEVRSQAGPVRVQQADPPLGRHQVCEELETPHVVTDRHRVGETAGVLRELGAHRADGMAAAVAKAGDVGLVKIVRLEGEQKIGIVAPLGIRGVMPFEDGLHPAQASVVGEKMKKAHHGAKRLAWAADGWGVAGDESTETARSRENSGIH